MSQKNVEKKLELIITIASPLILVSLFVGLIIMSYQYTTLQRPFADVSEIKSISYQIEDGQTYETQLPYIMEGGGGVPLPQFTVYATISSTHGDSIRVETVYTGLKLYVDDALIYVCGQRGTYPEFLIDPPTIIAIVPLPDNPNETELRFEYTPPSERDSVSLPRVEYGSREAIISDQFAKNGISFVLALLFLFIGSIMTLSALWYVRRFPTANVFICLGSFTFLIGLWAICENPFTALLVPHPATLYLMSYGGLLTIALPLLKFIELVLNPSRYIWFRVMRYFLSVSIIILFILQMLGRVSFEKNLHLYHIIASSALLVVLALIVFEYVYYKRTEAQHFILPTFVISFSALISFVNYELRFIDSITIIFEVGALIFVLQLAMICIKYIRDAGKALSVKTNMEIELAFMNQQLDLQKKQFEALNNAIAHVREIRHDLRHQIVAMREYINAGDIDRLGYYLDELMSDVQGTVTRRYCKNITVNSICSYYVSVASSEDVNVDVRLDIPEEVGNVSDMDLCIIVGNLLENAIDALRRVDDKYKYIKARARVANDTLSIIVENNFDGKWKKRQGIYISSKDDTQQRLGVGLQSVTTLCEKYEGLMRIDHEDNVWRVSTIVNLGS